MNTRREEIAKTYNSLKIRLKLINLAFVVLYLILFQAFLSDTLKNATFFIYLLSFCLIYYLVNFPLSLYSSFVIERRFGLSNQNFWSWLKDDLKESAISLFLFIIFMQVLYFLLKNFTLTWWVWIAFFWFFATVVLVKITPVFIIPLFFKYSAVEDKLKKRIIELSKKCRIKVLDVYKIDFSKKTNKLNAAVTGMGRTRRVILADNLIRDFTEDEIAGVLGHEFGHHKALHMWKLLIFGAASTFFSFFLLYVISSGIVAFLNAENIYDIKIFPAFMLVLFLAGFLTLPLQNAFSRKLERDADIFALRLTRDKRSYISLMKKLASKNLADPNPPKLVKFLFYSHPPISERIALANKLKLS